MIDEVYALEEITEHCFGGFLHIPKGTICKVKDNTIYYKNTPVCHLDSGLGKDSFCLNLPEVIKHEELLRQILPLDPPKGDSNKWSKLGEETPWGWKWFSEILEFSNDELESLLEELSSYK